MASRRDFLTKPFTEPTRLFRNPMVRDLVLDEEDHFVDVQLKKRIGDPLQIDDEHRKKLILVNFFSARNHEPMQIMADIVKRLEDKLNRDIFVNSITLDPEQDTPGVLEAFAESLGAQPGWTFVRANGAASHEIVQRMRRVRSYTSSQEAFYGTPGGFWGTFPLKSSPEEVALRLRHSIPGPKPGKLRRAGPARRGREPFSWTAREA